MALIVQKLYRVNDNPTGWTWGRTFINKQQNHTAEDKQRARARPAEGGHQRPEKKAYGDELDEPQQEGSELAQICAGEILAEAAYLFGWRPNEILEMRAKLFFRILEQGRKIYNRERSLFLHDLCDIGVIPHAFKNYETTREYYRAKAFPEAKKKKTILRGDDPKSAEIVASALRAVAPYLGRLN